MPPKKASTATKAPAKSKTDSSPAKGTKPSSGKTNTPSKAEISKEGSAKTPVKETNGETSKGDAKKPKGEKTPGEPSTGPTIASANGKLDLEAAFKWDADDIIDWLRELAESDPAEYGIADEYTDDETVEEGDQMKLEMVIANIESLWSDGAPWDPQLYKNNSTAYTAFEGVLLPVSTIFDSLGWVLSITAKPKPGTKEVTEKNFFLPLAAVFAQWCRTLIPRKYAPTMIHIAYWKDVTTGKLLTLLGSTPGSAAPTNGLVDTAFTAAKKAAKEKAQKAEKDAGKTAAEIKKAGKAAQVTQSARSYVFIRERQNLLKEVDLKPTKGLEKEQEVDENGNEMDIGYGRCAETFFYLWAGNYIKSVSAEGKKPDVWGFALQPTIKPAAYKANAKYVEKDILITMVDPCKPSCQKIIFTQMEKKWKWKPDFMIKTKGKLRPKAVQLDETEAAADKKGKGNADQTNEGERSAGKKAATIPAKAAGNKLLDKSSGILATKSLAVQSAPPEEEAVEGDEDEEALTGETEDADEVDGEAANPEEEEIGETDDVNGEEVEEEDEEEVDEEADAVGEEEDPDLEEEEVVEEEADEVVDEQDVVDGEGDDEEVVDEEATDEEEEVEEEDINGVAKVEEEEDEEPRAEAEEEGKDEPEPEPKPKKVKKAKKAVV